MGSKYKKKLEIEWEGKSLADIKTATMQKQADKNISDLCCGKLKRRRRRYK